MARQRKLSLRRIKPSYPLYRVGKAFDERARSLVLRACMGYLAVHGGPLQTADFKIIAKQPGAECDWRTVRSVLKRASGPNGTLQRKPTGGAANSKPRLGPFELAYLEARKWRPGHSPFAWLSCCGTQQPRVTAPVS